VGVYLFHGGEPYLAERAFLETWARLTADLTSDLDQEMLDGAATPEEVVTAASSVGFFSSGRVVGVRNWKPLMPGGGRKPKTRSAENDPATAAAEALASLPAEAQVVLYAAATVAATNPVLKLAMQQGEVRSFAGMRPWDVVKWVKGRSREVGLALDADAAELLVASAGDDLRLVDAEMEKLAVYAAGARVGVAEVRALVPDTAEHQVWDITDALLVDPGRAAVELDRALSSGAPAGRLSFMLVRHLRLLLAAGDAPPGAAGATRLVQAFSGDGRPLSDYAVSKAQQQAQGVDRHRLEGLYRRAAGVEAASRRGELDDDQALRLVVLEAALP
jgi:DNA polymerase-3 subunit delta